MPKNAPATPLPWKSSGHDRPSIWGNGTFIVWDDLCSPSVKDASYLIHAVNAYQKLVEALKSSERRFQSFARNFSGDAALIALHDAEFCRALLRELGED